MISANEALRQLWSSASLPMAVLDSARIDFGDTARAPSRQALRSSFRIGLAAQVTMIATDLAALLFAELRRQRETQRNRTGQAFSPDFHEVAARLPSFKIDAREAALGFASETFTRVSSVDDSPHSATLVNSSVHITSSDAQDAARELFDIPDNSAGLWNPLMGAYATRRSADEHHSYVRLHTNFPHHRQGLLRILKIWTPSSGERDTSITRDEVANALSQWNAEDLESEAIKSGMCATKMRTESEWDHSAMGKSVHEWVEDNRGPVRFSKIIARSNDRNRPAEPSQGPLRVIDMSRVLAAPIAGRCLSGHGNEVLLVSSPNLPHLPFCEVDTARGKRTTMLDLDEKASGSFPGRQKLASLLQNADVFLQAYRPQGLASRGFDPQNVQALRPGIVYASLTAYGTEGPWASTRGFDSLTQTASGMNYAESISSLAYENNKSPDDIQAEAAAGLIHVPPKPLPCQALDHGSGYLLAFGIFAAKCRAILEDSKDGWLVEVSLAGTGTWLKSLGRVHGAAAWSDPAPIDVESDEVKALLRPCRVRSDRHPLTLFGIKHATEMDNGYVVDWKDAPPGLAADEATWK